MATIKIKLKQSKNGEGNQGTIFYQIHHERSVRQVKTNLRLYPHEWDSRTSEIIPFCEDEQRRNELQEMGERIKIDIKQLHKIILDFEYRTISYTADDVKTEFSSKRADFYLFPFMENIIAQLQSLGRIRTSETYATSLNSFKRFRKNRDITFEEIDTDLIMAYEAYLRRHGITPNSSSFYMRNLRAVYNRAVDKGITLQHHPFKHVYTGVEKTVKRSLPLQTIKQIKEMDLSAYPKLDFARDIFMFSFYTRGMSFVDMAYLRKKDLNGNTITYRRRKTNQQLMIKWEKCMQEIINKYDTTDSIYLLPIIRPGLHIDERRQYLHVSHNINRSLKIIGQQLGIKKPLTMYVSRHAWASIARSKNIPISVISEGMGHDSETTTRIYLSSLDNMAVDKANRLILNSL